MIGTLLTTVTVGSVLTQLGIAVPSIITATGILTAAIHGIFKITNDNVVHAISWVVAVLCGLLFVLCNGLTFGLPVWADYVVGGIAGLIAGAASNGVYDWDAIKKLLDAITKLFGGQTLQKKLAEKAAKEQE